MSPGTVFDSPHYRALDESRIALVRELLPGWKERLGLRTALDAGCGVGNFSIALQRMGLQTTAFDGRPENLEEARLRAPGVDFRLGDAEDASVQQFGCFDFVLCFGLFYHLENPMQAMRNLHALTGKFLLLESMCVPDRRPVLQLLVEGNGSDQGLRYMAFYPSESCLVKMLYRAGFPFVWRLSKLPDHGNFRETRASGRSRTVLAASRVPLEDPSLARIPEPRSDVDPQLWRTRWGQIAETPARIGRFVIRPWAQKLAALRRVTGRH